MPRPVGGVFRGEHLGRGQTRHGGVGRNGREGFVQSSAGQQEFVAIDMPEPVELCADRPQGAGGVEGLPELMCVHAGLSFGTPIVGITLCDPDARIPPQEGTRLGIGLVEMDVQGMRAEFEMMRSKAGDLAQGGALIVLTSPQRMFCGAGSGRSAGTGAMLDVFLRAPSGSPACLRVLHCRIFIRRRKRVRSSWISKSSR